MGIAELSAKRSKDPSTQVGACIVSTDNKILSVGYNGMPKACSDDEFPWDRQGTNLETKYFFVCHAELNAILNSWRNIRGKPSLCNSFPLQRVCESNNSGGN